MVEYFSKGKSLFQVHHSEKQGHRETMEDASSVGYFGKDSPLAGWFMFGVFDGHDGAGVSKILKEELMKHIHDRAVRFIKEEPKSKAQGGSKPKELDTKNIQSILRQAYLDMDGFIKTHRFCSQGSCAVVVLLNHENGEVICANTGDSRAFIAPISGPALENQLQDVKGTKALSKDHKPCDPIEKTRVESANGRILEGEYVQAVGACPGYRIAVTRAFGDFTDLLKTEDPRSPGPLICNPEFQTFNTGGKECLLVLCCDGVFEETDYMAEGEVSGEKEAKEGKKVIKYLLEKLQSGPKPGNIADMLTTSCIGRKELVDLDRVS